VKSLYFQNKIWKIGFVFFFIFFTSLITFNPSLSKEPLPILVVERDVPQVFNHTAIVNHTTYVVNLSDISLEVTLRSVIPQSMYKESKVYPQFGKNAQLDLPMYYPSKVEIKEFNVLDRPLIEKGGKGGRGIDEATYIWKNVSLSPHEAAIIYFDNYLGEADIFHTPEGLNVSGLSIITNYQALLDNDTAEISLSYDVKNTSNQKMNFLQFEVFFPDAIMSVGKSGENIKLLDVTKYCFSSGVQIQPLIMKDGFGNIAQGNSVFIQWKTLNPKESHQLFAVFTGKKKSEKGEIYPLLIVNCRMDGTSLLQPTVVESEENINVGRFYYTQYATTIPDSKLFKFEKDKIKVVAAEKVSEPTFATLLPEEPLSGPVPFPTDMQGEGEIVPQTLSH